MKTAGTSWYNFLIYAFGQGVNLISPLLVMPYLIKVCGTEGIGKIAISFSVALVCNVVIDYSSYIKGIQFISVNRANTEAIAEIIATNYILKLLLFLGCVTLLLILTPFISFLNENQQLFSFSLFFVFGQLVNPTWILQGIEDFKAITINNFLSKGIYVLCVFVLVQNSEDYIFVNAYLGIGLLLSSFISYLFIYKKFQPRFRFCLLNESFLLFKRDFYLVFSQLFLSLYQYIPVVIVGAFGGNSLAGQYRILEQLIMVFRSGFLMVFNFVFPQVCFQIDKAFKNGFQKWIRLNGALFAFCVLIMSFAFYFASTLLHFFNVPNDQIKSLTYLLQLGLVIPFLYGISSALKQLLFALHLQKVYSNITIGTTLGCLIMLLFGFHISGLTGVFVVLIATEIIIILLYLYVLYPSIFKAT